MWKETLESKSFYLNRNNTEYMEYMFNKRQTNNNLEVKNEEYIIPNVSSFKYLRSIIKYNEEINGNVTHRIQTGWIKWKNALMFICDRKIPKTKKKVLPNDYKTSYNLW